MLVGVLVEKHLGQAKVNKMHRGLGYGHTHQEVFRLDVST